MPLRFTRFLVDCSRRAAAPRRSFRSFGLAVALSVGGMIAAPAFAQQPAPAAAPAAPAAAGERSTPSEIENAKYQAEGLLTRAEFVRALPDDKYYATQRLEKGARVVVVGSKGDWLKIEPPAGSFSYVNRAFVERFGNGKQGRVTTSNLLVKAGSNLQTVMW